MGPRRITPEGGTFIGIGVDASANGLRENPRAIWGLAGMERCSAIRSVGFRTRFQGAPSPFPHGGPP